MLISLILQPRDHFVHQFKNLRAEFICAVYDRLMNWSENHLAQAQRRCFARVDKNRGNHFEHSPKEYGLRNIIPPFLADSDEYWHHVAMKCFACSTQLGRPAFLSLLP
jgi:hypothetical protein